MIPLFVHFPFVFVFVFEVPPADLSPTELNILSEIERANKLMLLVDQFPKSSKLNYYLLDLTINDDQNLQGTSRRYGRCLKMTQDK